MSCMPMQKIYMYKNRSYRMDFFELEGFCEFTDGWLVLVHVSAFK